MLIVEQYVNKSFNSNTYVLRESNNTKEAWMVDVGNFSDWFDTLNLKIIIKGVFLTHAHYDHVYAINELVNAFPDCKIYCSEYTKKSLGDAKLNLSFYHDEPINFISDKIELLQEGDKIELFGNIEILSIETPGHNKGSLSFLVDKFIFTGDSLIPGHKVVTKLKSGNIEENNYSLSKLNTLMKADTLICSGHGPISERKFVVIQ